MLSGEQSRPLLPPADLFLAEEPFFVAAKSYARLVLNAGPNGPATALPPVAVERRADDPLARLKAFIDGHLSQPGGRVLLLAESEGRRESLLELLRDHRIDALVTKNSGGAMTRAKIDAAQALGVPVIMVDRPSLPAGVTTAFHAGPRSPHPSLEFASRTLGSACSSASFPILIS